MRILNFLLALPIALLMLSAASCDLSKLDAKLQTVLVQTCDGLGVAYEHYDALKESGIIRASTMSKVDAVRMQTDALCANPSKATTVSVTALAARAYIALNKAFREGGSAPAARLGYQQTEALKSLLERARQ